MNKFYRVIWNHMTQRWVVVSELVSSCRKSKSTVAITSLLTSSSLFIAGTASMLGSNLVSAATYTSPIVVTSGTFTFPAGVVNTITINTQAGLGLNVVGSGIARSTSGLIFNIPNGRGISVSGTFSNTGTTTINVSNNTYGGVYQSNGRATFADLVINETSTSTSVFGNGVLIGTRGTFISTGKVSVFSNAYQYGIFASGDTVVANLNTVDIALRSNNSFGLAVGSRAVLTVNGGNIATTGLNSHALATQNGTTLVFDGTSGRILPTLTVTGAGSAMLHARDAGSQITLTNQTLNISGAAATNTWGAKAETAGTVLFNGGSTGGTGLWATGANSIVNLTNSVDSRGSRVRLNSSGRLSLGSLNTNIGSLDGDTSAVVAAATAGNGLTIGLNNTTNNGSLLDNSNYAGRFTNIGRLSKAGTTTQILSGTGNTVGSVDVTAGTLRFEQAGAFTTTGDYTTQAGATTDIGLNNSALVVGGAFTQTADSVLNARFTAPGSPVVTADTARLNGRLTIDGFAARPAPVKASDVASTNWTLIRTTNGISGDFVNNPLTDTGLDYLLQDGHLSVDGKNYNLGFRLAWNEGLRTKSTGNFTVNEGTAFDVDTVLADQTVPAGNFTTLWDGKRLTKDGNGLLVLSAANTYTGGTVINAGTLQLGNGVTSGSLTGDILNNAALVINNPTQTTLTGVISGSGSLTQQGAGTTVLTAANTYTGGTTISAGTLQLGDGSSSGSLTGDIRNNGALVINNPTQTTLAGVISGSGSLAQQGAGTTVLTAANTYTGTTTISAGTLQLGDGVTSGSLTGDILNNAALVINNPAQTTLAGVISGNGSLTQQGAGTTVLSGTGSSTGRVDVTAGTLRFEQAGAFTTTGGYTTRAGATTDIGLNNSTLVVDGAFTQATDSALNATFSVSGSPVVTAEMASLNGRLTINGFAARPTPVKASDVASNTWTLIRTTKGISGDFVNNPLTDTGLDYLLQDGHLSVDRKDYNLGFRLAWNEGLQTKSTGNFTINEGTAFDIDSVLADQAVPEGGFATGWDGKRLTKDGNGLLVLSAANTYTGSTTLAAGALRTDVVDSIARSREVNINGGVFDLNGNNQRVNRLGGNGGEVRLNGATLTADNATATDNTTFAGDIVDGKSAGRLTKTGKGSLTLSGKTLWTGDTRIDGGELVLDGRHGGAQLVSNIIARDNTALSLRNGATLTGWIDPTDVNIDSASTWNMTADSLVDDVNLAGTLNFVAPSTRPMKAGRTLTTANWNGQGGTVVLNTVLGNDASVTDNIVVNGNTRGNTFVKVNNIGGGGARTVEGIRVVEVNGQSDGTFTKSGRIVAGAFDYSLVKKGRDWFLTGQYAERRPEAASYTANLMAANTLFNTRLHDRLGETQYTDALTGEKKVTSMWLRQVGGHNRFKDSSGQISTQSNRYVVQLGGDIAQWSPDELQRWHLGVMAGYGRNSSNSRSNVTGYRSEGTVSGYSAGLYATWYQNDETRQGMYLDSWAQYGWFDNDVKGQDIQNESYKSRGLTASLEAGYTHKLGEFTGSQGSLNAWYIQPQAQVIRMGVTADDHRESNGTRVSGEGENNVQTRLGMRTFLKGHSKIDDGKNRTFQPFVEANWIHNTEKFGVRMDGMRVSQDGSQDVGELKTGVEGQLNPHLNLWGNVGVQIGDKGYSDTSAMVGVKYSF